MNAPYYQITRRPAALFLGCLIAVSLASADELPSNVQSAIDSIKGYLSLARTCSTRGDAVAARKWFDKATGARQALTPELKAAGLVRAAEVVAIDSAITEVRVLVEGASEGGSGSGSQGQPPGPAHARERKIAGEVEFARKLTNNLALITNATDAFVDKADRQNALRLWSEERAALRATAVEPGHGVDARVVAKLNEMVEICDKRIALLEGADSRDPEALVRQRAAALQWFEDDYAARCGAYGKLCSIAAPKLGDLLEPLKRLLVADRGPTIEGVRQHHLQGIGFFDCDAKTSDVLHFFGAADGNSYTRGVEDALTDSTFEKIVHKINVVGVSSSFLLPPTGQESWSTGKWLIEEYAALLRTRKLDDTQRSWFFVRANQGYIAEWTISYQRQGPTAYKDRLYVNVYLASAVPRIQAVRKAELAQEK